MVGTLAAIAWDGLLTFLDFSTIPSTRQDVRDIHPGRIAVTVNFPRERADSRSAVASFGCYSAIRTCFILGHSTDKAQ